MKNLGEMGTITPVTSEIRNILCLDSTTEERKTKFNSPTHKPTNVRTYARTYGSVEDVGESDFGKHDTECVKWWSVTESDLNLMIES